MIGWIHIHRKLINWEWYSDIPVRITFLHLLLIANWEPKEWQGQIIKRGQMVIGRKKLSKEIGISEQQLRTVFNKLKSSQQITINPTNKYSLVTIVKYNDYQIKEKQSTNKINGTQPTINQQSTTTKEDKKIITNNINKRIADFKKSLTPFLKVYSKDMLNDFYQYWTEKNNNGKKMLFEMQRTWSVKRRLQRWHKNNFNNKTSPTEQKKNDVDLMYDKIKRDQINN